ncbi:hypothetical protein Droror1_Dr00015783 [Drosera rotundifolia]
MAHKAMVKAQREKVNVAQNNPPYVISFFSIYTRIREDTPALEIDGVSPEIVRAGWRVDNGFGLVAALAWFCEWGGNGVVLGWSGFRRTVLRRRSLWRRVWFSGASSRGRGGIVFRAAVDWLLGGVGLNVSWWCSGRLRTVSLTGFWLKFGSGDLVVSDGLVGDLNRKSLWCFHELVVGVASSYSG